MRLSLGSRTFRLAAGRCVLFLYVISSSRLLWPAGGSAVPVNRSTVAMNVGTERELAAKEESTAEAIPPGTILPVILPAISSKKLKAGDKIKAKIAQEVPLPGGGKIRQRATLVGEVVSSTAGGPHQPATLTIRFATLLEHGKSTPVRTNLRALASTMDVEEAQTPTSGPGESDVYDWLSTRQVGGDVVYGKEGPVARGSQIIGKSTYRGVFVKTRPNADGGCRGEVAGNDRPQAVWVFSGDACGVYGFGDLEIRHAGRTEPLGQIVLESKHGAVQIRSGSGALLRVVGSE
jgi:hypothetical protein